MDKSTPDSQTTAKTADPAKVSYWEKTKVATHKWFHKVGPHMNKLSNKLGAETFWPNTLDKEADKAARILRSFCIDGAAAAGGSQPVDQAGGKQSTDKNHKKHQIPQEASHHCAERCAKQSRSSRTPRALPSSPSCVQVSIGPGLVAAASSSASFPMGTGRRPRPS